MNECRGLEGETDTVVTFDYDGKIPADYYIDDNSFYTNLSNTPRHRISIVAVDRESNESSTLSFYLTEISPHHIAAIKHWGDVRSPSGEKATEYTLPVCPVSVAILDRAATSHNFTVASDDAEARVVGGLFT